MRRKRGSVRERVILVTSSAFVLAALTMAGIYMRNRNITDEENYLAKLDEVEKSTLDVLDQTAKGSLGSMTDQNSFNAIFENDMDYLPDDGEISEAGSGMVELGGKDQKLPDIVGTVGEAQKSDVVVQKTQGNEGILSEEGLKNPNSSENGIDGMLISETPAGEENLVEEQPAEIVPVNEETTVVQEVPGMQLTFDEQLVRPVNGSVLIPYNMSATVYFPTLSYYRYNPAQIISAEQGTDVRACADGRVEKIYTDAILGEMLVLDLGSGYEAFYGQLCNISVKEGDYVKSGQIIAKVQSPTRFYSVEGSNLYFQLKADNEAVNPEAFYSAGNESR